MESSKWANEGKRSAKQTIFVHSLLDDFGLSASEFRVFAHLYRRKNNKTGTSWPGIDSIAEKCRLSKQTVCDAIKHLERHNMIGAIRTPGAKTQYIVKAKTSDVETWEPFPNLDTCEQCKPSLKEGTPHSNSENASCLNKGTRKGYPSSEGDPLEGNQEGNPSSVLPKVTLYVEQKNEEGEYDW
jgi:DNA-binding MarR family transcriptional regulator